MKLRFIVAACILLLSACKKSPAVRSNTGEVPKLDPAQVSIAGNPDNPYDSAGYWHNVIVDYVRSCKPHEDTFNLQFINNCVSDFAAEHLGLYLLPAYFAYAQKIIDDREFQFRNVIHETNYSDRVVSFMDSLLKLFYDTSFIVDADYSKIKAAIVAKEVALVKAEDITPTELKLLLGVTSVARYSAYYWMHASTSAHARTTGIFKEVLKWAANVAGDVTGMIITNNAPFAADCSVAMYYLVEYNGY